MLSFLLLGQITLSQDGTPLNQFRSQKEAALLAYLAHTAKPHQRDTIASLFWAESSTKQSLTNLRTAIARLRKQTGEALQVTRSTIRLAPEQCETADSLHLLQQLQTHKQIDTAEQATALTQALDLYRGEFLAGFHPANAELFNEWVVMTREHIRRQVTAAYEKLGAYALANGRFDEGIRHRQPLVTGRHTRRNGARPDDSTAD